MSSQANRQEEGDGTCIVFLLFVRYLVLDSDLFKCARSVFYYEREEVWKSPVIPLHPAAEEYYRKKGYMR